MKPLVNSVVIRRSVEDVFDYCSDLANERAWNPDLVSLEELGPRPIAVGTRFRTRWKGGPSTECAYTLVDKPGRWEIHASAKGMDIDFRGEVESTDGGARLTITMTLLPRGLLRLVGPLIRRGFQNKEEKNLERIRVALEGSAGASAVDGG